MELLTRRPRRRRRLAHAVAAGPLIADDPRADGYHAEVLDLSAMKHRAIRRAVCPACGQHSYAAVARRAEPVRVRCVTCGVESDLASWVVPS